MFKVVIEHNSFETVLCYLLQILLVSGSGVEVVVVAVVVVGVVNVENY